MHVLDARDPLGTRCRAVEKYIRKEAAHKHLIFVINKCDLVPTWATVSYCGALVVAEQIGRQWHSSSIIIEAIDSLALPLFPSCSTVMSGRRAATSRSFIPCAQFVTTVAHPPATLSHPLTVPRVRLGCGGMAATVLDAAVGW